MAMYRNGIDMDVTVKCNQLLQTLQKNRDEHETNFKLAKAGYCKEAVKKVNKKLGALKEGNPVVLSFSFKPPEDMTSVYDTTINMLKWSTEDEITLSASEFRKLVEDDWDWSRDWFASNSAYSSVVASSGSVKGY